MGSSRYAKRKVEGRKRDIEQEAERKIHSMVTEQEAREAWASQEKLIAQIHDDLLSLPLEARLRIFKEFCHGCGISGACDCFLYEPDLSWGEDL